jgi:hypothetical protein
LNFEPSIRGLGLARRARLAIAIGYLVFAGCDADPQRVPAPVDPCVEQPCNVDAVVTQLAGAYENRDYAHFSRLLHSDFRFIPLPDFAPDPNLPPPPSEWGATEEIRIHRRMFAPSSVPPGEHPVPRELWLDAVTISLASTTEWVENTDYYEAPSNPSGLNRLHWKAWATEYAANVLFETAGETDYQLTGFGWFVVVQDLTKPANSAGAFKLYRWQDLGGGSVAMSVSEPGSWTVVKALYAN